QDLVITGSDLRQEGAAGHLYAFERATGKVRWKQDVPLGITGKVWMHNTNVYTIPFSESLLVFDSDSGKLLKEIDPPVKQTDFRFPSSPAIQNERFFYGLRDGKIRAIDISNRAQIWEKALPSEVTSDISLADGKIYVATADQQIWEIDQENGNVIRSFPTTGSARWKLNHFDQRLYFLQWQGNIGEGLKCLDLRTGKEIWSQAAPEGSEWDTFRPLIWRNWILVGSNRGQLAAFDIVSGAQAWTIEVKGDMRSIGASDSVVYVGCTNGILYAIAPPA
ncbi:MAG TPA: PQQ-binding-like beta-propeller repeat protein, partial [Acidobacteriota bacterium]